MKRLFTSILIITILLYAYSFAESATTSDFGIWQISYYVDEFNMPTDNQYIVSSPIYGTFSNSATTDSKLEVYIYYHPERHAVSIRLIEYGQYLVKNPYSKNCYYDLVVMGKDGERRNGQGVMYSESNDVYFEQLYDMDNSAPMIINTLSAGGTVRFALVERDNPLNKYMFTIEDATGFKTAHYAINEKDLLPNGDETPYDMIGPFSEGFAGVSYRGKVGYINTRGELQIPLNYDLGDYNSFSFFSEGYAKVLQNGMYGYIDTTGNLIIPCQYEAGSNFSQGLAAVKQNGKYGYIDRNGKTVFPFQWDRAKAFQDGFAEVKQGDYWGYINIEGKQVVPFQWSSTNAFSEYEDGLALVNKGEKNVYYSIDKTGRIVETFDHNPVYIELFEKKYRDSGLHRVYQNSLYGYADKDDKIVIPCQWSYAEPSFVDGYAKVSISDEAHKYTNDAGMTIVPSLYGIIDSTGKEVIPCEYDSAYYSEGYFITLKNGVLSITYTGSNPSKETIDEELAKILPETSIWNISADDLQESYRAEYEQCQVGDDEALRVSKISVYSYDFDVYYVFDASVGLSKIAYILNDNDIRTESDLDQCLQALVEKMKQAEGKPNKVKDNTTIWKNKGNKIELGKGKLSKYTGTNDSTVAIIFKKIES